MYINLLVQLLFFMISFTLYEKDFTKHFVTTYIKLQTLQVTFNEFSHHEFEYMYIPVLQVMLEPGFAFFLH